MVMKKCLTENKKFPASRQVIVAFGWSFLFKACQAFPVFGDFQNILVPIDS